MNTRFAKLAALGLVVVLSACGGGGGGSTDTTTPPVDTTPVLKSIAITPANPTLSVGNSQQLVATGTYADGTVAVLTADITWSGKDATVLSVFTTGQVTANAVGTDTVTAKVGSITGTTVVTVTGAYAFVAAGGKHTLARRADGTLAAWGWNLYGQLGDTTKIDRSKPVAVGTDKKWNVIAAGDYHSVALNGCTTAGCSLYAWGSNRKGQLGDATVLEKLIPLKIGTVTTWSAIAAGSEHTLAVRKDGTLWAWGSNNHGQLGDGSLLDKSVPTQITTGTALSTGWAAVAAGTNFSIGLQKDGTLWTWGGNDKSQLGLGAPSPTVVVAVPSAASVFTFSAISAGNDHGLAIRNDGKLFTWGSNDSGQLGNPSADGQTAQMVGTDSDWEHVAGGGSHSVARKKTDGSLWAWGSNTFGQLGNGRTTDETEPIQVGTGKNWIAISAGKYHTFALKSDNTLWGWGKAEDGQLGNGTLGTSAPPILMPTQLK